MSFAAQETKAPSAQISGSERLDAICRHAILGCVIFILVWAPLALGSADPGPFLVIQGATILAVAFWAVRWWAQRPFRLFWPPVCWGVLIFVIYALARCQLVDVKYVGRDQLTHVIVYAALFFVILHNLNGKDSATIVAVTLIIVGFCAAFLGVVQFVKHDPKIWGVARPAQYLTRGAGTFFNPNNFAGYLEMIVPLALAYAVMSRFGATIKVLLGYAALAMLAGVAATVSRGGILSVAAALVFVCLLLLVQRDFLLPSIVTLVVLLIIGIVFFTQFDSIQRRFSTGIRTETDDPSARLSYWQAAMQLYEQHRLWGAGPGHYDVEFGLVRPLRIQNRPEYVHNDYLNTLCEWGTVGLGIIVVTIVLLAAGVVETWNAVRKRGNDFGASRRSDRSAFLVGATGGIFALMLHATVEFNMQIPADAITAVALISLIAAQGRFATEGYWKNPELTGKIGLTILACGAVYFLGAGEIQRGKETYWLRRAKAETASADRKLAFLTKAHEFGPGNSQTDYLLGENLRAESTEGNAGYKEKALQAIAWFEKGMDANRFDPRLPLRVGMCLDWLDRSKEATPYFDLAERLDPNNYYMALETGRHYVAAGDLLTGIRWMQRSLNIKWTHEAEASWQLALAHIKDPLFAPAK